MTASTLVHNNAPAWVIGTVVAVVVVVALLRLIVAKRRGYTITGGMH